MLDLSEVLLLAIKEALLNYGVCVGTSVSFHDISGFPDKEVTVGSRRLP